MTVGRRDLPPPDPATVVDLLRRRAREQGETRAFSFVADGDADAASLSFAALDRRARALAVRLRELGMEGERAILLHPPGLEFFPAFLGCLCAGVTAVPAHLPRLNRPMDRLRSIVTDARPRAVLTVSSLRSDSARWAEGVPELAGIPVLTEDDIDEARADDWSAPAIGPETLAFLQYTSGSTATPKGVMVSHGNLLHNSAIIRECFGAHEGSRGVFWLPMFHDMGLIGGFLQTLYCGGESTLLSPVSFLQRPLRWLDAISRTGATISGGPNFAYDLCARKITEEQKAGLDLSHWTVAFNGAEPVRAETLDRFAEAFASCGFRREAFLPCYGLAEGTLLVSGSPTGAPPVVVSVRDEELGANRVIESPEGRRLVGSGRVAGGQDVAIVDPETSRRLPDGSVGEIWVSGPSVAQGYWGRDDDTFRARLGNVSGPFLRTGDLGFLRGDELFATGRLKDLIIVGGRNVYPQDVEWTAERCHPSLRAEGSAAFAIEVGGEERLVVVAEVDRLGKTIDPTDVIAAIRRSVAEAHELDVYAVRLLKAMSLPKTSSGKVRRHACRDGFLSETLDVVSAWTSGLPQPPTPIPQPPSVSENSSSSSSSAIADWLAAKLAAPLGIDPSAIDVREPFARFGLGSMQAVRLAGELEEWLGRPLSPTLVYDHPTIEALARHLGGEDDSRSAPIEPVEHSEPIAIIGIGCRFPGADGPEAYWNLLKDGIDATTEVPADRWDADAWEGIVPRRGGFLDRVDGFDADFFGISPREATKLDPQQRLLLEVAWEALEDAGQAPERLAGEAVGVFVGISTNDYARLLDDSDGSDDGYAVTGNASSLAANRLSYQFDFRGPSLAVDTACSSSLVAVHLACESLRRGEARLALAGGVNLILSPEVSASFAKGGFLAPDGRCKTFDALADGYVRGEGAGLVVLKPLSQARRDDDPIVAVIRGGAINQDGRTNGLTAPNRGSQEAVLRAAYRNAGVSPGRVGYVEAHGTGTPLGDPIEAAALGAVLGEGRPDGLRCRVGSAKTNFGHLEAAAGVAGLVKAALMLKHRAIPPSLHFREANPHIPLGSLGLDVATELAAWPEGEGPGLAGVSSFGFGGTNAHIVLEQAPVERPSSDRVPLVVPDPCSEIRPEHGSGTTSGSRSDGNKAEEPEQLLPISARDAETLGVMVSTYRDFLADPDREFSWRDVCHSAGLRKGHHNHRLALVARTKEEAVAALNDFAKDVTPPHLVSGRKTGRKPRLAFVMSGQGGLWVGMGRDLIGRELAFAAAIDECDRAIAAEAGWSVRAELLANESASRLSRAEFAQPAQFAVQIALARLWQSWGIMPDAIVGHSLGEVAAAHIAGALSLEEAAKVAVHRGRLMQGVAGSGKTAAVGLSAEETRRRIGERSDRIFVAAINGPTATTISGESEAMESFVASLRGEGVFARILGVDCAFHSPHMDPLQDALTAILGDLRPKATSIPLISTVSGDAVAGTDLDARYWGRNLREPVLFSTAIEALAARDFGLFLEVGPHPIHARSIVEEFAKTGRSATVLPSLRRSREGRESLLQSLAGLYTRGIDPDWAGVEPSGKPVPLPSYRWRRERFWPEPIAPKAAPVARETAEVDGLFAEIRWRAKEPQAGAAAANGHAGRWLILPDAGGVGEALGAHLEVVGVTCTVLAEGDEIEAALHRADAEERPYRGIVHLAGLDVGMAPKSNLGHRSDPVWPGLSAACPGRTTSPVPGHAALSPGHTDGSEFGAGTRVHGVAEQSVDAILAWAKRPTAPKLWIVTRGAQPIDGPGSAMPGLGQSILWGLGRAIARERPEAWGGLIDLDPKAPGCGLSALAHELLHPDGEDQVGFRGCRRYVARLVRSEIGDESKEFEIHADASYLVTGGLGGLGLHAARWLVDRGARRLILLGRRGLPPRSRWDNLGDDDPAHAVIAAIREMERSGATILAASGDVADEGRMAALFETWSDLLPPLRGIIHAAGVISEEATSEIDLGRFLEVLRPKVEGARVLRRLSQGLPIDWFIGVSSLASVLGAKEGAYAAANAFLDAFAHDARAEGWPAISVNFGPWDASGMADSAERRRAFRALGIRPLEPSRALRALGKVAASGTAQGVVADADWFTLKTLAGRGMFLEEIAENSAIELTSDVFDWRALPVDERRGRLTEALRTRLAAVLGQSPERIDLDRPLDTLGLDSLMAMELGTGVRANLGIDLPLTTLLEGPTIRQLAERALDSSTESAASCPEAIGEEVGEAPLAAEQQPLWFFHRVDPLGAAHTIAGAARTSAVIDLEALRRAWLGLVDRHPALRTVFGEVAGRPVQRVLPSLEPEFRVDDASNDSDDDFERRREAEARRPFDLESGPLLRLIVFRRGDDDLTLLLAVHHAVSDFWSIAVLLDDLGRLYAAEVSGTAAEVDSLPLRYSDFARWQARMLASPEGDRHWHYWRERLAGPLPELSLPTDRPRPAEQRHRGATRSYRLEAGLSEALADLGTRLGASPYVTLLAAFQVFLARYGGQEEVVVGSPASGRTKPGMEGLVGYFVNLLPMRASLAGNPNFSDFVAATRRTVAEGLEHQDFPFAQMVQRLRPDRDPSRSPIFQAMFVYQKAARLEDEGLTEFSLFEPGRRLTLAGLPLESVPLDRGASLFDLTLNAARAADGRLALGVEYDTDLFDAETVDRMFGHFVGLLGGVVADPSMGVADLPLMPEAERRMLVEEWGHSGGAIAKLSAPAHQPIRSRPQGAAFLAVHRRFEEYARRTPEAIAVVLGDRRISFRELNNHANRLADQLRQLGVGAESRVAICLDRSPELLAAILGTLKAGAAYVPIDPEYPPGRIALLLEDARPSTLLTREEWRGDLPPLDVPTLFVGPAVPAASGAANTGDADDSLDAEHDRHSRPYELAYIIYTSGSTGTPKGVMVSHGALANAFAAWESAYGLDAGPLRHLQMAGCAFDVFTGDWTRALGSGGTLVLCPKETLVDAPSLARLIDREQVDVAEFVPAILENLVTHLEATDRSLGSLRLIAIGSDALHAGLYERVRRLTPGRVVNSYGLTETTIDSTFFEGDLSSSPADRPVPIGRPFAGSTVAILDRRWNPVPVGVAGELCIGGAGVARGYLDRPSLTAERFIPDPFGPASSRLYRTGDLARWRVDGQIEFLGRSDDQVKVRGVRIELGEVEAALRRQKGVREAVVVALGKGSREKRLVAYVVPVSGATLLSLDLRRSLRDGLPEAMVPSAVVVLDALPLSANGKIDRRALPEPEAAESAGTHLAPSNEAERQLARIAAEVLGREEIGVGDDLFDLGIDSIAGLQIVARARQSGFLLSPAQLFRHPTIAGLASVAGREERRAETTATVDFGIDLGVIAERLGDGANVEDAYPLTPVQEGMLFHSQAEPGSGLYVEQFLCTIRGDLDVSTFEAAWRAVVVRHPALRTAFVGIEEGRPVQVVHRSADLPIEGRDWRGEPAQEQDRLLRDYLDTDRVRGFEPSRAPLMRLALLRRGEAETQLVWSTHHAAIDGWCVPILLSEVLERYEAGGREVDAPPSRPFRDYVAWLRARDLSRAEAYWKRTLAGFRAPTPLEFEKGTGEGVAVSERELLLGDDLTSRLIFLARRERVTPSTLIQGAWAILLGRYAGRNEVVFGAAVSGRPADLDGVETMIGMFINTLPVRVALDEESILGPWLRTIQKHQVDLREYEFTPPVSVRGWSEVPAGRPLFESIVVFENFPIGDALRDRAGSLGIDDVRVIERTHYPITLTVEPDERMRLRVGFDVERFGAAGIDHLLMHLRNLLEGMSTAGPETRLADLSMMPMAAQEESGVWPGLSATCPGTSDVEIPGHAALSPGHAEIAPTIDDQEDIERNHWPIDLDGLAEDDLDALIAELQGSGAEERP